jgi:hypothetical protein
MVPMTAQITTEARESTPELRPTDYWLSFCHTWFVLAQEAYKAGQDDVGQFFDELSDDAGDVWSGMYGQI